MVSEQQELVRQIDATQDRKQKQDLQRELERLVARMEEKGAQITKLRKHQQTVCVLPLRTTPSDDSIMLYNQHNFKCVLCLSVISPDVNI